MKPQYVEVSLILVAAIKFIDPTHSVHESSDHGEFASKRAATIESMDWLIRRANKQR